MKARIYRTSDCNIKKPCKEATEITISNWDERTCTEKYFDKHNLGAKNWGDEGTNHRKIKGGIVRQIGDKKVWIIELNTLEDLLIFVKKYGQIIVSEPDGYEDEKSFTFELEIYDGYRE